MLSIPLFTSLLASGLPASDFAVSTPESILSSLAPRDYGTSLHVPNFGADAVLEKRLILPNPEAKRIRGGGRLAQMPVVTPNPTINYTLLVRKADAGMDDKMLIAPPK